MGSLAAYLLYDCAWPQQTARQQCSVLGKGILTLSICSGVMSEKEVVQMSLFLSHDGVSITESKERA